MIIWHHLYCSPRSTLVRRFQPLFLIPFKRSTFFADHFTSRSMILDWKITKIQYINNNVNILITQNHQFSFDLLVVLCTIGEPVVRGEKSSCLFLHNSTNERSRTRIKIDNVHAGRWWGARSYLMMLPGMKQYRKTLHWIAFFANDDELDRVWYEKINFLIKDYRGGWERAQIRVVVEKSHFDFDSFHALRFHRKKAELSLILCAFISRSEA